MTSLYQKLRKKLDNWLTEEPPSEEIMPYDFNRLKHEIRPGDVLLIEGRSRISKVIREVDEEARAWLARNGYDKKMGARPMARLIQEQIKKPLAEELLFGQLSNGGHVKVTIVQGKIKFLIEDTSDTAMVKVN